MRATKYNWATIIPEVAVMVNQGLTVKDAAKAKAIPYKTLYKWYAQYQRGEAIMDIEKRDDGIVKMYRSGLSIQEIASKVSMSFCGVRDILIRLGVVKVIEGSKRTRVAKEPKKDKVEILSQIQKGHAKPMPNEKVFQTVQRDENQYRLVPMYDAKRTVKLVRKDDPRTNEQIREEWRNQQIQLLKDLAK